MPFCQISFAWYGLSIFSTSSTFHKDLKFGKTPGISCNLRGRMRCHSRHESTSPGAKCDKDYDKIGSNMIEGVWFCLILSTWFNLIQYFNPACIPWKFASLLHPQISINPNLCSRTLSGCSGVASWDTHFTVFPSQVSFRNSRIFCGLQIQIHLKQEKLTSVVPLNFSLATLGWCQVGVEKHNVRSSPCCCWGSPRAGRNHRSDAGCGTSCAQTGISSAKPQLAWHFRWVFKRFLDLPFFVVCLIAKTRFLQT